MSSEKKRGRRILKWTFIVFGGLLAIILVGNALAVWITGTQLDRELAKIRAAGGPVSLADLEPKPVPPDQNAATYLRRAREDLVAIDSEISQALNAGAGLDDRSPAVLNTIRSAVTRYPKVIPLLEQAAACSRYASTEPSVSNDLEAFFDAIIPRVQDRRPAARLLGSYWPEVLLAEGKREEAVRSNIALLRLCRLFDQQPALVDFLASIACRGIALHSLNHILQTGSVSDELRQELEDELAKHNLDVAFRLALKTERAVGFSSFRYFFPLPYEDNWFARGFYNRLQLRYLEQLTWYIEHTPEEPSVDKIAEVNSSPPPDCSFGFGTGGGLLAAQIAQRNGQSLLNAIRVLNALQRRENRDEPPAADLSDLGLPREATLDPFTGKPLIVKRVPDGWLVYSVGQNGIDDGGHIDEEPLDIGYGPPAKPDDKEPEAAAGGPEGGGSPISAE
ncbi:MAG: hypothetical protein GX621_03570 [Pirellulaceae bacterium]|nr:hypothetical protein [Pirellulaceae bacterium]